VEVKTDHPWHRVLEHPRTTDPDTDTGVVRFTYLLPLSGGALISGVSDSNGGAYAVRIEGLPDSPRLTRIEGIRGQTLRWFLWRDTIFDQEGNITDPQDLAATSDALFLLAHGTLYRSEDGENFMQVSPENASLLHRGSPLVSAPLELHEGRLFAASPMTGGVFEAVPK